MQAFLVGGNSTMGAIGPGIKSIEHVLEFPVKKMSKGTKIPSSFMHKGACIELEQSSPEVVC